MTGNEPVLSLREARRVHRDGEGEVVALAGCDLDIFPGELVAVMGPSGSGKSTLVNLAGGLDRPTSGTVSVHGRDLAKLSARELAAIRRRQVGVVFQDLNLIPALTACENVALPLELDGMRPRQAARLAREALRQVGCAKFAGRFPERLSGGQQQRIAIARALVGDRTVLLADEPTGALDSRTSEAVLGVLRSRCDQGAAVLLVTHESRFAGWADRMVFLRDGQIVDQTEQLREPKVAGTAR